MNFKKNKRGTSVDNFFVAISFFGVAVFMIILLVVWGSLTTPEMDTNIWQKTSVGINAKATGQGVMNNLDNIAIFAYFGLHLGVLVLAFLLRSHPVVYMVAILLTAIMAIIAAPLSNAYNDLSNDEGFIAVSGQMPKTNFIMNNYPKFEILWCFITAIVLFGLARNEGLI